MYSQVLRNIFKKSLTLVYLNKMNTLKIHFRIDFVMKFKRLLEYIFSIFYINDYLYCIVL